VSAGGTGVHTAQVFSPPYLFRGPRPDITTAPSELGYGQSFEVESPDAVRIAQVTLLRLSSVTHSFNMNQRFNRLTFSTSTTGLSIRAPDRPEIAPPGDYLLFILDGSGVPSIGRVVRLGGTAAPPPPPPPPTGGIAMGSVWKYDDRNVDPGSAWTSLAFDDSGWKSGPAQLGYGDGDEATVLTHMTPAQPSYYFRRKLTTSQPGSASVRVIHDDGVAVFVNGSLVFSKYMARGLAHSVYASATSPDNELDTFTLPASAFVAGENIVAVMVKQGNPTSSDVSFDLELKFDATAPPPPAHLTVVAPNGGEVLTAGSVFDVRWTSEGAVTMVRLEVSQDGGATWSSIADVTNSGQYSWTLPALETTRALLRISDVRATNVSDQSNGTFTIHTAADGGVGDGGVADGGTGDGGISDGGTPDAGTGPKPPNAILTGGPFSGRAPLQVYLDGTATKSANPGGWISRFSWDLGDGTTSTRGFLYHTYSTPGRYRVVLRAFDEGGRVGTAEQVITVN